MNILVFFAVFLFFVAFLIGVRTGRATNFVAVWPAFLAGIVACFARSLADGPLVPLAIASIALLHLAAGYITAWLMGKR